MTFAEQLRPHVERVGTGRAAMVCGVTPRTLQLWLARPDKPPNAASQAGAISLLRRVKTRATMPASDPT